MLTNRGLRAAWLALVMVWAWGTLSATTERIVGAVDAGQVAAVAGNVSPKLKVARDMGLTAQNLPLSRMSIRFSMTAAQKAALTQLLVDLQNPASTKYHQWLTPEQFAAQFGLAPTDIAKVQGWLAGQGFTVTGVARSGLFVNFSGTVGQAESAFKTELHTVTLNGETHIANVTAPSLPEAVANVTAALTGLNDFKMKPHLVQPRYTSSACVATHCFAPGDFYTVYDEKPLLTGNVNGQGVTVAVVGQTDVYTADLANFRTASGLAANVPTVVTDGADPGYSSGLDLIESELDLEWIGATAPEASYLFVNSTDVIDGSLTYAVDNDLAPIISDSYGDCEPDLGSANLVYYDELMELAATEGITIVAATGDAGATDCDTGTVATGGLAVDFPAVSPYVTGVGGTEFAEGIGTYWSATNGSTSGSALSYIPETVWNDTSSLGALAAGGGGASAYFSKPSWQTGTGVPADFSRDVPDLALNASPAHDPYVICVQGYCSTGYKNAAGNIFVVGGTSAGAPSFAGLLALVEQKTGGALGVVNPVLYALASSSYGTNVFHDVTMGNNDSPCTTGSTNCPNGGSIGYAAAAGYDRATGLGSVNAFNLVNDWTLVSPAATTGGPTPTITNIAGSATSVPQGTALTLTATVASALTTVTGVPTGSVQFTVDSVAVGAAATLSSAGVATYTLGTGSLALGSHIVQATYLADTNFAGSKGAFGLSVTSGTTPDFTITPTTATVNAISGSASNALTISVNSLNGFSGSVTLVASVPSALNVLSSFTVNPVTVSGTGSGVTALTLFACSQVSGCVPASARKSVARNTGFAGYGAGVALAGLLVVLLPRRRRVNGLMIVALAGVMMGLSGCFSTYVAPPAVTVAGTAPGTYVITVSATGTINGTAVTHSSAVSLVVAQ